MKNNYNGIFQTCFKHVSMVTALSRGSYSRKDRKSKNWLKTFPPPLPPHEFLPKQMTHQTVLHGKLEQRIDPSQKYLPSFLSLDTTDKGNWQNSLGITIQMPTSSGHNLKPWFFSQETWHLATEIQSRRASRSRLHRHRWPISGSLLSHLAAK